MFNQTFRVVNQTKCLKCLINSTLFKHKTLYTNKVYRVLKLHFVELQGVEPWSRQGNRRAFYMLSCR